jgi:CRP/FNR family transcriptional regulator, anaerobic regulatory protein
MDPQVISHIKKFVSLKDGEAAAFDSALRYKKIKKNEYLLKEGQVCAANHFVVKGCCRMYFTQENGMEQIVQFGIENWWITDYQSLDWQQPSYFNIQAVESSEIAILDQPVSRELLDSIPALDRYFRLILQRAYATSQQRIRFIYGYSGADRFHHFCDSFPWFVQRVPQYMIASYLGLTPEFVSKIKKRRK